MDPRATPSEEPRGLTLMDLVLLVVGFALTLGIGLGGF